MNKKIRTIFFGTHDFAAHILQGLIDSPLFSVQLVITRPDKPTGRKKTINRSPVKLMAVKNNTEVRGVDNLKGKIIDSGKNFDLGICAQFGSLIPKQILDMPKRGIVNVHTSLLPKYRGASPIQTALIKGEKITGVSIMLMDEGLDSGPIICQRPTTIFRHDTYADLNEKMAMIAKDALIQCVPAYLSGDLKARTQNHAQATYCERLTRDSGRINWNCPTKHIYNLYRGLHPWPGIWTKWQGKRLKLIQIRPADHQIKPGRIVAKDDKIFIGSGSSSIQAITLQLEGKKAMAAKSFLNGLSSINQSLLA